METDEEAAYNKLYMHLNKLRDDLVIPKQKVDELINTVNSALQFLDQKAKKEVKKDIDISESVKKVQGSIDQLKEQLKNLETTWGTEIKQKVEDAKK